MNAKVLFQKATGADVDFIPKDTRWEVVPNFVIIPKASITGQYIWGLDVYRRKTGKLTPSFWLALDRFEWEYATAEEVRKQTFKERLQGQ